MTGMMPSDFDTTQQKYYAPRQQSPPYRPNGRQARSPPYQDMPYGPDGRSRLPGNGPQPGYGPQLGYGPQPGYPQQQGQVPQPGYVGPDYAPPMPGYEYSPGYGPHGYKEAEGRPPYASNSLYPQIGPSSRKDSAESETIVKQIPDEGDGHVSPETFRDIILSQTEILQQSALDQIDRLPQQIVDELDEKLASYSSGDDKQKGPVYAPKRSSRIKPKQRLDKATESDLDMYNVVPPIVPEHSGDQQSLQGIRDFMTRKLHELSEALASLQG